MTYEEKIFYSLIEKIYTISICEITSINKETSFCNIRPVTGGSIITDVPVFQIGNNNVNIKIKLKIGDVVPVLHSKEDISNYIGTGNKVNTNTLSKFNKSNSFILPLNAISKNLSFSMPDFDIEINGTVKIDGDMEVTGEVRASDCKSGSVSLLQHVHGGVQSGSSTTLPPQ